MSGSFMPITDEMKMILKDHYNGTEESIQFILTSLKEKQYSKAQAVLLLKTELKLSLVDADRIVMNAAAWSEGKGGNETFREAFIDAITSGKSLEDADGPEQIKVTGPQNGFIRNDDK